MTETTVAATDARNRGIDLLRGVSILLVILNHVGIRIPLAKTALAEILPKGFLQDLNYNGYEAVFVFFVISGFLITRRSLERWLTLGGISLREFYVRRGARILPCLIALVAVLAILHLLAVPNYVISRPNQSLPGAVAAALGLYLNWYEGVTGYLPGSWDILWSLSIEEAFYLAFPLLCLLCGSRRWFVAILAVLALSMPFSHAAAQGNEIWQEKAYLPGMGAIAVGILAALFARHLSHPSQRTALALRIGGALGICAILFAGRLIWHWLLDAYLLVLTGSAAALVLGMHWNTTNPRRIPGLDWLQSCGRLSYEIYLTHMFCVFSVVAVARWSRIDAAWGWIWYPLAIGASWLLGWIVARRFSQPCERRLRRYYAQRAASRHAIAIATPADV
ncbi:MAG TPA: acyltransferase [Rudaea sp.]|jgi:peptidoglycan/LPS O-acetylase OafA/YrhL